MATYNFYIYSMTAANSPSGPIFTLSGERILITVTDEDDFGIGDTNATDIGFPTTETGANPIVTAVDDPAFSTLIGRDINFDGEWDSTASAAGIYDWLLIGFDNTTTGQGGTGTRWMAEHPDNPGYLDSVFVQGSSVVLSTTTDSQSVLETIPVTLNDVSLAVDGEETGEVMGIGYDDSGQATDGGGDIIDGADGLDDTIYGNGGDDVIDGGLGNDIIYGGTGNDVIDAGQSSSDGSVEIIHGDEGDDTVLGGFGADSLYGGVGTDTYSQALRTTDISIDLEAETAVIDGTTQTVVDFENATGGAGDDGITGSSADNVLLGGAGADTIDGAGGDDTIDGGIGADVIDGGAGDDSILGGDGNDVIHGDNGAGDIIDLATFTTSDEGWQTKPSINSPAEAVTYNSDGGVIANTDDVAGRSYLVAPSVYNGDLSAAIGGTLSYDITLDTNGGSIASTDEPIEIDGTDANGDPATIIYNGNINIANGATNSNTLDLVHSNFVYSNGDPVSEADFAAIMASVDEFRIRSEYSAVDGDTTTFDNMALTSGPADAATGNDTIDGGAGDDVIFGDAGNDSIDGGADNDTIDGGEGDDTLAGGTGNDSIDGGTGADVINGGDGSDIIDGGVGNDTIDGGDGDDTITGGECEMEWLAGGTTPSYFETDPAPNGTNTTTQSFANSDGDTVTLTNMTTNGNIDESGAFGAVDDAHRLTATGEVNSHDFSAPVSGAQLLITAIANGEKLSFEITLADGTVMTLSEAIAAGHVTVDTSASDETVVGDELVGGGTAGNADSTFVTINSPIKSIDVTSTGINAGAMAYELYVDTNAPVLAEVAGTGDDSILGGAGNDTIDGECGDDTIDGGIGNDVIDGGTGDDTVCGGDGDDTLSGGAAFGVVPSGVYEALSGSTETFVDNTGQTVTYTQTLSGDARELADPNFHWGIEDSDQFANWLSSSTIGYNGYSFDNPVNGLRIQWAAMNTGETLYFSVDGVSFNLNTAIANGTVTYVDGNGFVNSAGGIGGEDVNQIADPGTLIFNIPVSSVVMVHNGDTMIFGAAVEGSKPATSDDVLKGGAGDDTFILVDGNDTIADFNTGNTGSITDGDQTNNDFVDLSGYYNATTLAAYNAANPSNTYDTPLEWLQADQGDDGVLNDTIAGWDADNTLTISGVAASDLKFDNTNVFCFAAGTMIQTANGEVAVEDLRQDDLVLTRDRGFQPLRWIGGNVVSAEALSEHANLRPIRIRAGALGSNLPQQDLLVSPQHRVLVSSKIVERMFDGEAEVLIAAKQLVMIDGIDVADDVDSVEYFHFLFDQHEIVFSNGAETESLFTGPEALKAVSPEARTEILTLFPELSSIDYAATACRTIVKGRKGRQLAVRHKNKNKPLLELH